MTGYYDKQKYEVESEFSGLGEGETRSGQICPACNGGQTQEGSLSVSRRGGVLLYHCHRASCSFGGACGVHSGDGREGSKGNSFRSKSHIPLSQLDQATVKFLATKFGVPIKSLELAGLRWTGEGTGSYSRRISYPIYGPDSKERGAQYRSYEGKQPKVLTRLTSDDALGFSWYKWKRTSNILVLVEDAMSAIKVAPHHHAAALLGTNLSEAKVHEIKYHDPPYERVYLCLDNDATTEAIKTQLKWVNRLPNLLVLGLQKDIKNMGDSEFSNYLERLS